MPLSIGLQRNTPKEVAIVGSNREQRIGRERYDLLLACNLRGHEGRIGGLIVLRFPEDLPAQLVKADEAGALRVADWQNDGLFVNHSGTIVPAAARSAFIGFASQKLHAPIRLEAGLPDNLAIRQR